jgi:[ribosomal protein S18]-alanine N-acetyltransferase
MLEAAEIGMAEQYTFSPMGEADARAILAWRYEGPYAAYNTVDDGQLDAGLAEMLDPRSPYFAVRDATGALIGFFAFGTAAEVGGSGPPGLMRADDMLSVGLGMRPDLTGKGLGLAFVNAGLAFARERYAPSIFRLFVLALNQRAMRVYERAGFERVDMLRVSGEHMSREFIEMRRPAHE